MILAGIEAMNAFGGTAFCDVAELAAHRGLDSQRFDNLLMREKAVVLPFEDTVTFAVNAARPLIDGLSGEERDRIELLITCTESGVDFGKSVSTYIHHYLGLNRNCRLFEIKQACYSGTAGLHTAVNFVRAQGSPGAKALVVASDISRFIATAGEEVKNAEWSYAEPSSGAGAVAMLVGEDPHVFAVDHGANGYYGYEVMDTCRPAPDLELGDADLSLLSYLDCSANAFEEYSRRVPDTNYRDSFDYLAFHTPFGGMVKGAHRTMMRRQLRARSDEIDRDFTHRVAPGLAYCQRVGNIMGGSIFLALAAIADSAPCDRSVRVGMFSYGSGCCSEFYSGVISAGGARRQPVASIAEHLDGRYRLTIEEYESVLANSAMLRFGVRNVSVDSGQIFRAALSCSQKNSLILRRIKDFHREYEFVS
jgi:polyketide biosynthesis 3-hydroxy-3-methylglutaryl-CoA synthase-like enzyme PksG